MANEKRLIDANALDEAIRTDYWEHFTQCHDTDQTALIDMVCEDIGNAPTVDAVKVKHGRWKDIWGGKYDNQKLRCSVCNGKALYDTKKDELGTWVAAQQLTQFCPHCGAKMDGDGNGT